MCTFITVQLTVQPTSHTEDDAVRWRKIWYIRIWCVQGREAPSLRGSSLFQQVSAFSQEPTKPSDNQAIKSQRLSVHSFL